jgi:hypothetical protein
LINASAPQLLIAPGRFNQPEAVANVNVGNMNGEHVVVSNFRQDLQAMMTLNSSGQLFAKRILASTLMTTIPFTLLNSLGDVSPLIAGLVAFGCVTWVTEHMDMEKSSAELKCQIVLEENTQSPVNDASQSKALMKKLESIVSDSSSVHTFRSCVSALMVMSFATEFTMGFLLSTFLLAFVSAIEIDPLPENK